MSSAQILSWGHKGLLTASQKVWLFVTGCRYSCRESGAYGWTNPGHGLAVSSWLAPDDLVSRLLSSQTESFYARLRLTLKASSSIQNAAWAPQGHSSSPQGHSSSIQKPQGRLKGIHHRLKGIHHPSKSRKGASRAFIIHILPHEHHHSSRKLQGLGPSSFTKKTSPETPGHYNAASPSLSLLLSLSSSSSSESGSSSSSALSVR